METRLRTPTCIYECYVEYIRPQIGEEAKLKFIYPKDYEFDEDTKKSLTSFLFPLKDSNTKSEEHFTFTLTNLEGQFRFGFCRYPPKGDVCMCILSDLPWFKVFYRVMDKVSDMQKDFQRELVLPFLKGLKNHPVPNLTTDSVLTFKLDSFDGQVFTFPLPNPRRLPEIPTDHNLTQFYPSLHYEVFLCLFANLMFERRIIITSNSLSMLSSCVHGAVSLLYPLFWQHIFIPITPPHLMDYCTAPMPFLMGIHSSILEQVKRMPINDAVILDIDNNELETPYADDLLRMPPHLVSKLRHKLKKTSSAYGDAVTRALLNCMVAMFGGYRKALKMREGEKNVVFDEDSFLQSRPGMGPFLSELFHLQHFQQFVNNRIDRLSKHKDRDIFDEEAILFDEEGKSGKTSSEQIVKSFKYLRHVLQKQTNEAFASVKEESQKMFQGRMVERVSPGDTLPSHTTNTRFKHSLPVPKRPPPVIASYEVYKKQKAKLRQSLILQGLTLEDEEFRGIFNDAASIDSKESGESIDDEVLTAMLINFEDDPEMARKHSIHRPMVIRPRDDDDDDDDTDTDSLVSSSSGNSGNKMSDIISPTEEEDKVTDIPPMPIPPPRRKKKVSQEPVAVGTLIDLTPDSSNSHSPSVGTGGSANNSKDNEGSFSSLDDFTSGIAETLVNISKRCSDPMVASTVSHMGRDLFNSVDNDPSTVQPPLPPVLEKRNNPWEHIETSPNLRRPAAAPPKPQPYIGTGYKHFMETRQQPGTILTPNVESAKDSSHSSSSDPLANIFGNGGLHAYALKRETSNT